jgi:hypothetical protein
MLAADGLSTPGRRQVPKPAAARPHQGGRSAAASGFRRPQEAASCQQPHVRTLPVASRTPAEPSHAAGAAGGRQSAQLTEPSHAAGAAGPFPCRRRRRGNQALR